MNILLFSRSIPAHGAGGMEQSAWDLALGLADLGHHLDLITSVLPEGVKPRPPSRLRPRLRVWTLPSARPGRYSGRWWRATRRLFAQLRAHRPGSVILSVSAGARAVLPERGDMPALLQAHGTSLGEFWGKIGDPAPLTRLKALRNAAHVPADLNMYRRFDGIVAVSAGVAADLARPLAAAAVSGRPVEIIPNGVDTQRFGPDASSRARLRRERLVPAGGRVILFASRLHWQKGLRTVQEAVARLARPRLQLWIAGAGPDRRPAERRARALGIAGQCHFFGAVDHAELPALYSAADVFVQCSQSYEGLPLSLLEAMASDLPVVLSDFVARRLPGARGLLSVRADDSADVARGLASALEHTGGSRDYVLAHHRQEHMILAYERFLQRLLDGPGARARS